MYELPTIPLTPIDLVNRRAAATGSVQYAMATGNADYNGHYVTVSFKPYAVSGPKWNAEYHWGERVVLARGSMERCLEAAHRYYNEGHRGASVSVGISQEAPETEAEQIKLLEKYGFKPVEKREKPAYWTGKHEAVSDSLHWSKHFADMVTFALAYEGSIEDWAATRNEWLDARRKKN